MAEDNMLLGQFRLDGIPPAPRGIPQIEVTFDIDSNGILDVSAKDRATGRQQKIKITASTNLEEGEVKRMVEEARRHSAEDIRRKELAEARNMADQVAYQVEKSLKEMGDKVPDSDRRAIEAKVAELKKAVAGDDLQAIRRLIEEVQQASMAMGEAAYAGQQAQGGPTPGTDAPPSGDDDVVDGEFHSV